MVSNLKWKISKSNQLWVRWKDVDKPGNGIVKLKSAEFFGPVLSDCENIEESGFINIDLTRHLLLITPSPYIIKLSWNKLTYQDTSVAKLEEILLHDGNLGFLSKLKKNDLILLDCTDHTTENESRGFYKAAFEGMIYNEDLEPYTFS